MSSRNKIIKLSFCQSLSIFMMNFLSRCIDFKNDKLFKLFSKGTERVDKEMDMVKILRNIRFLRIRSRMNVKESDAPKLKYYVKHS
jgi:hypothetical protein